MRFSKWINWKPYSLELLPSITYRPKSVSYAYTTEPKIDADGNKYSVRSTPYTEKTTSCLSFSWLWCSCSFYWEDERALTEEESVAYEASRKF